MSDVRASAGFEAWRAAYEAADLRDTDFETMSGVPLEPVYGPEGEPPPEVSWPGQFPYTRGPYASMYRSKLWTMRMFAGFGTAEDTNLRFRDLLAAGGDGLSVAYDLPTLMGRDSDDPMCEGEVGRCGVAVDTLADTEDLFAGIDLGVTTTSMTINSPAPLCFAMYVTAAEAAGTERKRLGGTLQNDMLKEFQAQKEYIFPPRPSLRLVTDVIRFTAAEMPRFHPPSPWPTGSPTWRQPALPDWPSTPSLPGCRSSSTPTSTSSRRSPSTGPLGASGPVGCATATGPPTPGR
jgi:methylmalonyl-CoA mutase N-terminal domain/subunit